MNHTLKHVAWAFSLAAAMMSGVSVAAVPLHFAVETSRPGTATFQAYHGETLEISATVLSYGDPLDLTGKTATLYYQTNGMGAAWWATNATVSATNVITAAFTGAMDPGAPAIQGFLGIAGENYRAAFLLRFRDSPGATPNVLPLPAVNYNVALTGEPTINGTNLTAFVSDRAETDPHAPGIVSNIVTKSYVEDLGISGGGGSGGVTTNAVCDIVTNAVGGAWTTGRRTPDTYLPSCAVTNTAVRWNASASHWEVYLEGRNDGTTVDGWYTGYVYDIESVNPFETVNIDYNSLTVTVGKVNFSSDIGRCVYATRASATRNALGLAYERDIRPTVSNTVTKAYVEGLGIEAGVSASAVTNIAGGIVASSNLCTVAAAGAMKDEAINSSVSAAGGDYHSATYTIGALGVCGIIQCGASFDSISSVQLNQTLPEYISSASMTNAGAVAEAKDYADTAIASAGHLTQSAADAAYYPKASGEAWSTYWDGDDVRVTVTNYDSAVNLPSLYIEQRTNETAQATNAFRTVWREMAHWEAFLGSNWNWRAEWSGFSTWSATVESELAQKADRAWGYYDSHTGNYAPDGYTQISSSNIMIAAGMGYQKTITTSAEVWILTANEPYEPTGISTNGGFQIRDSDGNVQFEIVKGDKVTAPAQAGAVTVTNATLYVVYNIVAAAHPTAEVCLDLSSANWKAESSADCPATVTWTGSSGRYVAAVTPTQTTTKLFMRATYQRGGDTYINNRCAVGMSQLVLGGVTYTLGTATIDGNTVLTLTPAN